MSLDLDSLNDWLEEVLRLDPALYYQCRWWLLVDERECREGGLPYSERPSQAVEWPPFTGVRVALGGDRA